MPDEAVPPRFVSLEFHTRFFPGLLRHRLRRKGRKQEGTSFTSTLEMMIVLAVCLILSIIGLPSALTRGSIVGWVLTLAGVGGIVLLVILSAASHRGARATYDDFLMGVFFFFVSLGVFIGIPVGMESHSFWLGFAAGLAGLCAGYVLGIFAGLGLQHLGWIAGIVNMLAGLASMVVAGTMLIMLMFSAVRSSTTG